MARTLLFPERALLITLSPLPEAELHAVELLLDAAFGADRRGRTAYKLREGMAPIPELSLAAFEDDRLVGALQCWPIALHGADAPYVDPHPNDDMKPFYWTDVEQRMYPTTFKDHPSRNPPTGTAVTYWQATLALNGVDEASKSVTGFDYVTYGFLIDAAGNVKLNYPQQVDGENHRQTLKNEWSSWTFT